MEETYSGTYYQRHDGDTYTAAAKFTVGQIKLLVTTPGRTKDHSSFEEA